MKPFDSKRKKRQKIKTRITWLSGDPAPVTDIIRTPATGPAVKLDVSVEIGETAAGPARAVSCPPDIAADNVNKPSCAGPEQWDQIWGVGSDGGMESLAEMEEHQDIGEESGVEAAAMHGGRPPQHGGVEPLQPIPNPGLQRWTRVRARLAFWRLACHDQCGRVCAARRQNRT